MKAQLLHLSGPFRGDTVTYDRDVLLMGSDASADVRYPVGTPIAARHAELRVFRDGCRFHLRRLEGDVFVNGKEIEEVILNPEDIIELGTDGPQARFRIHSRPGSVCKPVRQMLDDAQLVHRHSGIRAATRGLIADLLTRATWQLKVGVPVLVLLLVFAIAYAGGRIGGRRPLSKFEELLHDQEVTHAAEVLKLREQLAEYERRQSQLTTSSRADVEKLRAEFARRALVVDSLVASHQALTRVLDEYSNGVGFVHGVFSFQQPAEKGGEFFKDAAGERVEIEYVGSAFLVSDSGWVVTNRHVVQPWWENSNAELARRVGFEPVFLRLEICFPGKAPAEIDPKTIHLRQDEIDVAVIRSDVKDVPVLPLSDADPRGLRGQRVILLGYPTGVTALLAKTDPTVTKEVMAAAKDLTSMIHDLARRNAITPVATQGALNAVLEKQLVYDAGTTSGGSGGPVFGTDGTVVGVNFAILRDFGGSNFGVPIRFAQELLREAESRPK